MPKPPRKPPDKLCPRCGRPFSWRKKWERDWPTVKFCSDACRSGKRPQHTPNPPHDH